MDVPILLGAITTLCGVIAALARVAWTERGSRLEHAEKENAYFREQLMPTMARVLDTNDKMQTSLAVLTRVVEDSVKGRTRG